MARIFISHSNMDNAQAADFMTWLRGKGFTELFLDFDKHSGIQPGANWEKTLYRQMEIAQAVIIMVTPNWMASKWCFAEFVQARALGKEIFPVIAADTKETIVGEDLQIINLLPDRDDGLDRLEKALRNITLQSPQGFKLRRDVPPFPGLAAFDELQAAVLFGRDPEIRKAMERLRICRTQGGAKLILLLGPSGSGKSSLLRAGLAARLDLDRGNWIVLRPFRPGRDPYAHLVDALLIALDETDGEKKAGWRAQLEGPAPGPALRELARALRRRKDASPDASILLPLDQAEEVVTLADPAQQTAFLTLLSHLLADDLPFVAVAALRADYLPALQAVQALSVPYDLFPLDAMPLDRISDVIRGPARVAHVKVEDGLVSAITQDAKVPDALPLVAAALRELYERFGADGDLTLAEYESLGARAEGINPLENIVRQQAEGALASADRTDADDEALRKAFVLDLVRLPERDGVFVKQAARLDAMPALARAQIQRLVEARLLVRRGGTDGEGGALVEVAHEALFRVWPRLAEWLDAERGFIFSKTRIEHHLKDWQSLGNPDDTKGLLSGLILDHARNWIGDDHVDRLTEAEREYITLSVAFETAENRRRAQEKREKSSRERLIKYVLCTGVVGLFFVAIVLFAMYSIQNEASIAAQNSFESALKSTTEVAHEMSRRVELGSRTSYDSTAAAGSMSGKVAQDTIRPALQNFIQLRKDRSRALSKQALRLEAQMFSAMREIYGQAGNDDDALEVASNSIDTLHMLRKIDNSEYIDDELVKALVMYAAYKVYRGHSFIDVVSSSNEAISISQGHFSVSNENGRRWGSRLAQAHEILSDGFMRERKFSEAAFHASEALNKHEVEIKSFDFGWMRRRAILIGKLADAMFETGDDQKALDLAKYNVDWSNKILNLSQEYKNSGQISDAKRGLSIAYERASFFQQENSQFLSAHANALEAYKLLPETSSSGTLNGRCFAQEEGVNGNKLQTRFYTMKRYAEAFMAENGVGAEGNYANIKNIYNCFHSIIEIIRSLGSKAAVNDRNEALAYLGGAKLRLMHRIDPAERDEALSLLDKCANATGATMFYFARSNGPIDVRVECKRLLLAERLQ